MYVHTINMGSICERIVRRIDLEGLVWHGWFGSCGSTSFGKCLMIMVVMTIQTWFYVVLFSRKKHKSFLKNNFEFLFCNCIKFISSVKILFFSQNQIRDDRSTKILFRFEDFLHFQLPLQFQSKGSRDLWHLLWRFLCVSKEFTN